ncbi:MAG: nitrile hydratase [Xanthobacteraceae bacterium]
MTQTENLVKRLPNDIGGLPAEPILQTDHAMEPWEKRCHALADVLDFHKIINTEEKRCGVEALGSDMVGKLTYYERWIVAFANILFRKGILTPTEFALKKSRRDGRTTRRTITPSVVAKAG